MGSWAYRPSLPSCALRLSEPNRDNDGCHDPWDGLRTYDHWVRPFLKARAHNNMSPRSLFSLALKEALQYHISLPTPLSKLAGGITLARCGLFFHRRHRYMTFCSIIIFSLACFMGSLYVLFHYVNFFSLSRSWSTFFAPTLVAWNINVIGSELDLNSTYFESQLGVQMVSSGSAQRQELFFIFSLRC